MPSILDLPCEVTAHVLRHLDDIAFLIPTVLACRHFYSAYEEYPTIKYEVIEQQIGSLLSYAIVASRTRHLEPEACRCLLERLYCRPQDVLKDLREMSLRDLIEMGRTSDIIQKLCMDFAASAWSEVSKDALRLSSAEKSRFCKAFYRFEILCTLVRLTGDSRFDPKAEFVAYHVPWENEQIGCVYDYLDARLGEATLDYAMHDVELGEYTYDYLEHSSWNFRKQDWLTQGIVFIHKILQDSSYDNVAASLSPYYVGYRANLFDTLGTERDPKARGNRRLLELYKPEELLSLSPTVRSDVDTEPYRIWFHCHKHWPYIAFVMGELHAGVRKRAYVMWDLERLEQYNLFDVFEQCEEDYGDMDEGREAMQHSWYVRSKIWLKGGRGCWKLGDLSRVQGLKAVDVARLSALK